MTEPINYEQTKSELARLETTIQALATVGKTKPAWLHPTDCAYMISHLAAQVIDLQELIMGLIVHADAAHQEQVKQYNALQNAFYSTKRGRSW